MLRPPPQTPIISPVSKPAGSYAPLPSQHDTVDVGRVIDTIRRNWKRIALGVAVGLLIAAAYMRFAVPRYEATSTVRIEARQSTLPTIYTEQAARDEIFTEIEVLRSRTIAADVVDSLAMQFEVTEPRRKTRNSLFSELRVAATADTGRFRLIRTSDTTFEIEGTGRVAVQGRVVELNGTTFVIAPGAKSATVIAVRIRSRDEAITKLRKAVDIGRSGLQASIIALRYESTDPVIAYRAINEWTASYIRRRQSVQRSEARNTAAFIQAQLDTLTPELARAEDRLLAFRGAQNIVAPEFEASTQVTQYAELQATRNELDAERSALDEAVRSVRSAAEAAPSDAPSPYRDLLGFPTLLRNQAASELLRALSSLDEQRTALLLKRTAADPDVILMTERIRVVENQLRGLTTTYLRGLSAQVAGADRSLAGYASRLRAVPAQQVEYARLQRAPRVYEELVSLLQTRLKEAQITEAVQDASVRIIDPAVAPTRAADPNPPLILAFGLVGGLLLGTGAAFWRESRVSTIRTRRELEEISDVPVLGLIPAFDPRKRRIGLGNFSESANTRPLPVPMPIASGHGAGTAELAANEAFVRLLLNAQWSTNRLLRSLLVTSPLPGDGKTTSVLHLAAAAVSQQRRVLVIDADMRCGGLSTALSLRDRPGLADLVTRSASLIECINDVTLMDGMRADVIGAGSLSHVVSGPLLARGLHELLAEEHGYDLILIDTPPVNVVTDAASLASLTDGVLLVARAGVTSPGAVDLALDQLNRAGANVIGVVLNGAELLRAEGYGSMDHYRAYALARA